jgi:DNA-binding NarL/FixJ family response regulator
MGGEVVSGVMDQTPWRGLPPLGSPTFDALVGRVRVRFPVLSPRQAAVVVGIWKGLTEDECAGWLHLAPGTVHGHSRDALARLKLSGIERRADVIREVERTMGGSSRNVGG